MAIEPRAHELTAVLNRELFDDYPAGCDSPGDRARWDRFRRSYHAAQALHDVFPFPLQIDFELNSTCQMTCQFCVHGQRKVAARELSMDDFCRVIDEGERHGLCSIKLNYINEPLLRKDLPEFIRYARLHGVLNTYLATNGLLLDERMGQRLIDVGLSKIMISLDAMTADTFRLMRRSSAFHRIVSNVVQFIRLRDWQGARHPLVRVNFLRTPVNAHEADEFVHFWTGLADMIGFQTQVQVPGVDTDLLPDSHIEEPFRCSFPSKLVVVDSAGSILPCCTFSGRMMPLGNIWTTTIADAWNSQQMRDLRALHAEGRYAENPICLHCIGGAS